MAQQSNPVTPAWIAVPGTERNLIRDNEAGLTFPPCVTVSSKFLPKKRAELEIGEKIHNN